MRPCSAGKVARSAFCQVAALDSQSGDHLIVGQRHVAGAGGLGDVGVLHLGGELVDVGDLQAALSRGSVTREPITAWGAEPVPTV